MRSQPSNALRVLLLFTLVFGPVLGDDSAVPNAVAAFQNGDLGSAERILRTELNAHPNEAPALEVLGVVLDQQGKLPEADQVYRHAVALSPNSPGLLNNYGNHLLHEGRTKEARAEFLKVEAIQPRHSNATLQLARIALELKQPSDADRYLSQLGPDALQRSDVAMLRMQTDYALQHDGAAGALLGKLSAAANGNAGDLFRLAVALSSVGQYGPAETLFAKSLELQPQNTEALHDLGLAASHAGHDERARDALQQALDREPGNVDVLYDLSAVDVRLKDKETALALLARAHELAPQRADIEFALARLAGDMGYFGDAVQAWQAYRKLAPNDDVGQREYAFAETALGENTSAALTQLQAYVRAHPKDPAGHYELGTALIADDRPKALQELNRALILKPDLAAAHMARGLLNEHAGDTEAASRDFEAAAAQGSVAALDHLGETYLQLNRTQDAVRVLQKAEQLAPQDSGILLHLGRALTKAGDHAAATEAFARYRALGGANSMRPNATGLVDFLGLSAEEQQQRYRAGVSRTLAKNPDNLDAEVRYLGLLLEDGKQQDVQALCRKLQSQSPDAAHLEDADSELLAAREYRSVEELIGPATALPSTTLTVDRAIAVLHDRSPQEALAVLDSVPLSGRTGDYYLARAEVLSSGNQMQEAADAFSRAARMGATRADVYLDAALLLLAKDDVPQARTLLETASAKLHSEEPELRVLRAFTKSISERTDDSELLKMENQWPDWPVLWMVHAAALAINGQHRQADQNAEQAETLAPAEESLHQTKAVIDRTSERQQILRCLPALFALRTASQ